VFLVYLVVLVIQVFLVVLHFRDNQILDMMRYYHIGYWNLVFGRMVGILFLENQVFLVDLVILVIREILVDLDLRDTQ